MTNLATNSGPLGSGIRTWSLTTESLPEILARLERFRASGVLEAQREDVCKRLFIERGVVLYASSTDRGDSLAAYVTDNGFLKPAQMAEIQQILLRRPGRMGAILVEENVLAPDQVHALIRSQVARIAWSLFTWGEGEIRFRVRAIDDQEAIRIRIPLAHMVIQGSLITPSWARQLSILGGWDGVPEPRYSAEVLIDHALDQKATDLLRRVDGQRTVAEVVQREESAAGDRVRLLSGFAALRLILVPRADLFDD